MPGERGAAGPPGVKGDKVRPKMDHLQIKWNFFLLFFTLMSMNYLNHCVGFTLFFSLPKGETGHKGPDGNPGRDGARVS